MAQTSKAPARGHTATLAGDLRVVLGQLRRRLREHANLGDLTPSQLAVLGRLDRDGPVTVTSLAKSEGVRPQSMGATVAGLEAAGLVRRDPDPTDGRQSILSLTPACREWIKAHRAAREDWLSAAIRRHLTLAEQDDLAKAVALLSRLVET